MVLAGQVATWLGIIVASITILTAIKSAYNGYIRRIVRGLLKVEELCRDVEAMYQRQDKVIDGLRALAYAQEYEDAEVPIEQVEQEFDVDEGPRRFLDGEDGDSFVRGGGDD